MRRRFSPSVVGSVQRGRHLNLGVPVSRFALVAGLRVQHGQVRSRHNLKPSGTRFEGVSGLRV